MSAVAALPVAQADTLVLSRAFIAIDQLRLVPIPLPSTRRHCESKKRPTKWLQFPGATFAV
jgi:hypothetical protein